MKFYLNFKVITMDREVYKTNTIEDTELIYTILREKYPNKQIEIDFSYETKEYTLNVTKEDYTFDPNVPLNVTIVIIYGDTDSVFMSIKFNRKDFEQNRKDAFKLAIQCGDNITNDVFKRPPIDLEFEKVYQPFILLTKKRYIGKKYEDTRDPLKLKTLTTSGIAITKRNYCNMVKKCYKQVIDIIMDSSDLDEAISVYKKYIDRIDNYQIDTEDLVISAQIGKEYSCKTCKKKVEWIIKCDKCKTLNPKMHPICKGTLKGKPCNKKFECLHTFSLGHINLAQKFLFRNDEICIGDRIQYIFVENENTNVKSELTEDPTFAKNNNIKYNRGCYLEQLAKSIMGFFKVVLQNEEELIDDLLEFTNEKLVEYNSTKLKISDFKITEE
jgi:DNA polymerase elongation subunit (family B)